jgi:hypothetical protein
MPTLLWRIIMRANSVRPLLKFTFKEPTDTSSSIGGFLGSTVEGNSLGLEHKSNHVRAYPGFYILQTYLT